MSALDEARIRRYLLGRMAEDEAQALEGEYFARGEALEQVWGIENDLVDAYVAGQLGAEESAAFEEHYLASPLHRDRVASARALRALMSEPGAPLPARAPSTAGRGWLAVAAGLLLALAAWWLWPARPRPGSGTAQITTPTTTTTAPGTQPTEQATPSSRKPSVAAFALSPVLLRGQQATPVLRVRPDTDEIAITLEGERPPGVPPGSRLPFTVTTVEGARVVGGRTRPGPGFGVAHVAADRLPPGDYIFSVLPPGDAADAVPLCQYFFRIPPR